MEIDQMKRMRGKKRMRAGKPGKQFKRTAMPHPKNNPAMLSRGGIRL